MKRIVTNLCATLLAVFSMSLTPAVGTNGGIGVSFTTKEEIALMLSRIERDIQAGRIEGAKATFEAFSSKVGGRRLEIRHKDGRRLDSSSGQAGDGIYVKSFSLVIKSIEIKNDSAFVTCELKDFYSLDVKDASITLKKESMGWRIVQAPELHDVISSVEQTLHASKSDNKSEGDEPLTPVATTSTPNTLIPVNHPGIANFLINSNLTQQYLRRRS